MLPSNHLKETSNAHLQPLLVLSVESDTPLAIAQSTIVLFDVLFGVLLGIIWVTFWASFGCPFRHSFQHPFDRTGKMAVNFERSNLNPSLPLYQKKYSSLVGIGFEEAPCVPIDLGIYTVLVIGMLVIVSVC